MENEAINYTIDFDPLLEELQILNEGTVSNGEKLDQINEYLIAKDKLEKEEKEAAEKKSAEDNEKQEALDQEKSAADQQQTETYTELLTDIRDQVSINNYLLSGEIYFSGVIFGTLLLSVLWNRFIR